MRPQTTGVQAAGAGLDPACSAISAGIRHPWVGLWGPLILLTIPNHQSCRHDPRSRSTLDPSSVVVSHP
jgi:hypothetical protein